MKFTEEEINDCERLISRALEFVWRDGSSFRNGRKDGGPFDYPDDIARIEFARWVLSHNTETLLRRRGEGE